MRTFLIGLIGIGLAAGSVWGQKADPVGQSGTPTSNAPASASDRDGLPQARAVIDAFIEATGGTQAYASLPGMQRTYAWTIGEDTGSLVVRSGRKGAFSTDMTMDGSAWHVGEGSNGAQYWLEDANGVCHKADDATSLQLHMQFDPSALADTSAFVRAMTVSR